ncbi:hypothetical protein RB195_006735 [Necator americanus]|uniref:AXH domain-containing protein n=1 Tax=Necator americanus TaxID=51031 RepID=A0ABR1BTZ2_NECAM
MGSRYRTCVDKACVISARVVAQSSLDFRRPKSAVLSEKETTPNFPQKCSFLLLLYCEVPGLDTLDSRSLSAIPRLLIFASIQSMNGDGQQQPGPSGTAQWSQPALADILTALQMQLARTAAEGTRVIGQSNAPVLSGASPLVNPLQPQISTTAIPNPTPLPVTPAPNPLLHSYQQLLNPAFLELQRQLIAQQTAQFRLPLLPTQMTSSMSLPSLRQIPSAMPHVSMPGAAAALPARPVPRKPAPVMVTASNVPTSTATRSNGSQFAVPQDPVSRKPSLPPSRPSTSSEEKEKTAVRSRSPEFEMGKLPVKNYIPSHFMKGTMIQMASGKLKKVEEMSSDDFLLAAPLTREFNVDASVVVEIAKASTLARVKFAVGQTQYEATLEPQLEHPFFVLGKGWCSCDPHRTAETYGLECQEMKVGDVCISLSRRSESDAKQLDEAVALPEAAEVKEKEAAQAAIREELSKEMGESNGRNSAPPTRYHPYSKKIRKVSES